MARLDTGLMTHDPAFRAITDRHAAILKWLDDNAPYAQFDQHHLDPGTPEQAYWHMGYATALADLEQLFLKGTPNKPGNSTGSREGGLDE